jgi:hypothetical protein
LQAPWPLALLVALIALAVVDAIFRVAWHPHPSRLPEQFSPAYLERYIAADRDAAPVVVLGDSALWGYDLPPPAAAVQQLAGLRPRVQLLNLSYEGGSVVNSYFALRRVLASGVHPAAVIVNLNSKEFNASDSAYNRLLPALERTLTPILTAHDRALLKTLPPATLPDRLDAIVSRVWALYRYRIDVRVALFGFDDVAGLVNDRLHRLTGEQARYDRAHQPTADAFLGTYDLDPIAPDNVEAIYLRALRDELVRDRIPAIAFLTPTNQALLAATVDDPGYADNLRAIARMAAGPGIHVIDLDRLNVGPHFIDNDHLDALGSRVLAARLARELDAVVR